MLTDDRKIFETEIQPFFIELEDFHRILFVGCDYYTRHYNKWYCDKDYWTLDFDPDKTPFGGKQHIEDSITNIEKYFKPDSLDLILCNGVYGWGLCEREDSDRTFLGCYRTLRQGGILMVGWNQFEDPRYHIPGPPEELASIQKFEPYTFPPRSSWRIVAKGHMKHTFDFYRKNEAT